MHSVDIAVVGGGIVGLATAFELGQREPSLRVVVLEKEAGVAEHQSGRSSGVLHSGIFYKPGSAKAEQCREGRQAMVDFCAAEGLPCRLSGKVIVAAREAEVEPLEHLYDRAQANGVEARVVDAADLAELEPHVSGLRALHVPTAGVIDYRAVCERLAERIREQGGQVVTRAEVHGISSRRGRTVVHTRQEDYEARDVLNAAGLHADRVMAMTGERPEVRVVPVRAEFFALRRSAEHLVRHLVYPVPAPRSPFVGPHLARLADGEVECGPALSAALGREAYGRLQIDPRDLAESVTYGGFLRFAVRHVGIGASQAWRSLNKRAFISELQRLVPQLTAEDLVASRSAIVAQAIRRDGIVEDEVLVAERRLAVHVLNAPPPAATSALYLARNLADQLLARASAQSSGGLG